MQTRQLGDSDLHVSEIALGSWLTYGGGVAEDTARACVRQAFDCGINFIDTANVYALGGAESFLGDMLADYRRDDYILATKLYFPMSSRDRGLSKQQIRKQIDASLQRLRTDYVDLYQCHRFDSETPLEETMSALAEVIDSGKARYIGFSEWSVDQLRAAHAIPGTARFVSSQPQYSMLWREPERALMDYCERNGIRQIVWSPLAQGVLSGKYKPGQSYPPQSRASSDKMNGFMNDLLRDDVLSAVQQLAPIAADLGISMAQLALAWVLRKQNVAAAIVGASRPQQVIENVKAADVVLGDDELQRIDEALASINT